MKGKFLVNIAIAIACASATAAAEEAQVDRGRYLVETIAGCGNCHTNQGPDGPDMANNLGGGLVIAEGDVFSVVAPNITPDPDTGIGAWSDDEIARAIREGVRPDGSLIIPVMPVMLYRGLSDGDLAAMVAYLRTVAAVVNETPDNSFPFPLPPAYGPPIESVPEPDRNDPIAYGAYLAGPMGHCIECHTPFGANGQRDFENRLGAGGAEFYGPWGVSVARNITPAALADWSDDDIRRAITAGVRPDGERLLPPMGFVYYAGMTDGDLDAVVAYLRAMPPAE